MNWKLVPEEPTPEMLKAVGPDSLLTNFGAPDDVNAHIFEAMNSAAPDPFEDKEFLARVSKAIDLCSVCEGDAYIADGVDEAALSIPCPPCFGTGYDARGVISAMKGE